MAYDEGTAQTLRQALTRAKASPIEKKMFGGLCFMVEGHMACGVVGKEAMFRVGPESYETALARPHARPMDFTGKPLTGMVYVAEPGLVGASLKTWVETAVSFARSSPAKKRVSKTLAGIPSAKKKAASANKNTTRSTPVAKKAASSANKLTTRSTPVAKKAR